MKHPVSTRQLIFLTFFQTNSKPKNLDDQEMPKKLLMLSKLRDEAKKPSVPKPKVPKSKLLDSTKHMGYEMKLPGMKKDLKPVPIFQQQEGEKERQFFRRVNQMTAVSKCFNFTQGFTALIPLTQ